jgi:hypothetical protein
MKKVYSGSFSLFLTGLVWVQFGLGYGAFAKKAPLCYVPGVGGAKAYALEKLPGEMEKRGIEFYLFQIPVGKTVIETSKDLCPKLARLVKEDPDFECHFFAYSMGGVLMRYAYHHLSCPLEGGQKIEFSKVVKSLTTAATPHRGTPLANWLAKQFPNARPEMLDMSEESLKRFNDPKNAKYYSPAPASIPLFSLRSSIRNKSEAVAWSEFFGFDLLTQILKEQNLQGDEALNDGVVPRHSQAMSRGGWVEDLQVPHSFFGSHGDQIPGQNLANLIENHYHSNLL